MFVGRDSETEKITSTSTERQKLSQSLAPVVVIISGNSLVFGWGGFLRPGDQGSPDRWPGVRS